MILRFSCINKDIQVNEHELNILKLENKDQKFAVVKTLSNIENHNDDISLFTDTYDSLKVNEKVLFVGDPIASDYFFDNVATKLRKDIYLQFNAIEREDIQKLTDNIANTLQEKLFMYDLPITIEENISVLDLLKLFKAKINLTELKSAYDTMNTALRIAAKFFQEQIIIVNNLANYFTDEELSELDKECSILNLTTLFLN